MSQISHYCLNLIGKTVENIQIVLLAFPVRQSNICILRLFLNAFRDNAIFSDLNYHTKLDHFVVTVNYSSIQ